jgi:hypothetical protein
MLTLMLSLLVQIVLLEFSINQISGNQMSAVNVIASVQF